MKQDIQSEEAIRRQAVLQLSFQGIVEGNTDPAVYAALLKNKIEALNSSYFVFSDSVKKLQNELSKQDQIMSRVTSGVRALSGAVSSVGSVFGATSIGISSSIQNLNRYNIEIRTSAAQFVKYGQGISQTKAQIESLSETFKLTRQQTTELMSSFEGGFDFAALNAIPGMFEKISDSVGGSKEAMASMLQSLQGIASKSTQFNQILMSSFSGLRNGSKESIKDIQAAGLALITSGKISVAEAKKLDEFVNGGKTFSKEDQAQKQLLDDQMRFFRSMNKLFEDISIALGEKIMPTVAYIGKLLLSVKDTIIPVAKWTVIIGTGLSSIAATMMLFSRASLAIREIAELGKGSFAASVVKGLVGPGTILGGLTSKVAPGGLPSLKGGALAGIRAAPMAAGGLMLGSAAAGLAGGNLLAREIGTGVYGWANSIDDIAGKYDTSIGDTKLQKLQIEKAQLETTIDANRMRGQWYTFGASAEWNPFSNKYGSGRDRTDEEQASINRMNAKIAHAKAEEEALNKIEQKKKDIEEQDKAILAPLVKYALELSRINEILDLQNSKLQARKGLMSASIELFGMSASGGGKQAQDSISDTRNELYAQASVLEVALKKVKENNVKIRNQLGGLENADMDEFNTIMSMGINDPERTRQEDLFARKTGIQIGSLTREIELTKDLRTNEVERIKIGLEAANIKGQSLEQSKLETSLLRANMGLANAYGFGLKATVQMQMQVVDSLSNQKTIMQGQLSDLKIQKEESLKKAKTEDERNRIEFVYKNLILQKQNEIVEATREQAELTKSLREGYISAIAAMTTGAGVFSRIIISQDKRLGNLVSSAPNKIRALRAGSELEGRRESGRFGAGYLTEGAAGDAEKQTLSQYGTITGSDLIRSGAENIMNFQDTFGNKMSGAMNSLSNNITGTSQVFGSFSKFMEGATSGLMTFGKALGMVSGGNVEKPVQVLPNSTTINSKAFSSPEFIKTLTDAFSESFVLVAKEAANMAIKQIQQG